METPNKDDLGRRPALTRRRKKGDFTHFGLVVSTLTLCVTVGFMYRDLTSATFRRKFERLFDSSVTYNPW